MRESRKANKITGAKAGGLRRLAKRRRWAARVAQFGALARLRMHSTFQSLLWKISVPQPWRAQDTEHCAEFTQPEGAGALHISGALKQHGDVSDQDTRAELQQECPENAEVEAVEFGDFSGYSGDYVDWDEGVFWKKWFVRCGKVLLYITYNCKRGDEELEKAQICQILSSLECRNENA